MREACLTVTVPDQPAEPLRFAAAQLRHYLATLTGQTVALRTRGLPGNTLVWGNEAPVSPPSDPEGDGFEIDPIHDGAVIRGGTPRAVLHGVYALLEQLACRWSLHGRGQEVVPRLEQLPPIQAIRSTPRFGVRGYSADIMTWHYADAAQLGEHLVADAEFVDWMGKSAANAFLFIRHPFDSQLTIPELLPEFARRGIDVEYGGHVIPLLLPRELFAEHPEFFPQSSTGARSELGNLCTSNPAAVQLATQNAVRYVQEYPELRVLHIWGADLWDGGWCRCAACAHTSVQDQSLRFCNAVATALAAHGIPRPVCYLAYHDTIDPDVHEHPADGVVVEYAPRERCYAHALDDPLCARNHRYRDALERYVDLFAGRVRVFEYYADAILFCGCALPLGDVIAADLDYYSRLGIREITNLQFGSFSLWAYPLNFVVYAAASRAAACDVGQLRCAYAQHFGAQGQVVAAALGELEAVMRTVVTYGDIRRPPRHPEAASELRPRVERAIERLARVVDDLTPAGQAPAVGALQALLRYNRAMLAGVRQELGGGTGQAHYEVALDTMRAIDRQFTGLWGAVDLPVIHAYYSAALGA